MIMGVSCWKGSNLLARGTRDMGGYTNNLAAVSGPERTSGPLGAWVPGGTVVQGRGHVHPSPGTWHGEQSLEANA